MDANLDKNFTITYGGKGEGEAAKTTNLNVYLWIGNLLNTRNVNSVYRFTGVSDDDGYLAAAQYQPLINSQNNPDASATTTACTSTTPSTWACLVPSVLVSSLTSDHAT